MVRPAYQDPFKRGDWRGDLHRRIRYAWIARKLSQLQFAELLEVEEGVAEAILNGMRAPTVEELMQMPVILDVSGDWLLTGARPIDRRPDSAPAK
jgi:transcriptional regulator with XRE-family HTH domain